MVHALLLIALSALPGARPGRAGTTLRCNSKQRTCSQVEFGRALNFLASDGSYQTAGDVCSLFSSDLTAPSFCLRGDGTSTGSLALSAVGSPTTQTMPMCGNALNCGPVSRQLVSAASYFQTASMAQPSGSFWGCVRGIVDAPLSGTPGYMIQSGSWGLQVTSTGNAQLAIVGGTALSSSAGVVVGGASQLPCFWYHYVGAGNVNTATLYVDGVQVAQNTTEPPLAAVSANIITGKQGTSPISRLGFAMFGTGDPSSTLFARLAAATAPTPQGTRGEQSTTTRNSASWVSASDGSLTVLQPGRLGVSGGVVSNPSRTNPLLYSEQANQSGSWIATTTAPTTLTVTADYANAPDGARTADRILATTSGGNNLNDSLRQIVTLTAGSAYEFSFFAKDNGGTTDAQYRVFCTLTPADIIAKTSYLSQLSTSAYTRIKVPFTVPSGCTGAGNVAVYYVSDGTHANGTTDIDVFGGDVEPGSVVSTYCASGPTSSTCSGDQVTVPTPSSLSAKEGCARVCVVPSFTGSNPSGSSIVFLSGNAAGTARFLMMGGSASAVQTANNGTFAPSLAAGFVAGSRACFVTRWSAAGNFLRIDNQTAGTTASTTFSGWPAFDSTIQIGGLGANLQPLGSTISDIQLGTSAGACQ